MQLHPHQHELLEHDRARFERMLDSVGERSDAIDPLEQACLAMWLLERARAIRENAA